MGMIKAMKVIPVAGHDSMLLNLSGAHGPYFTRNLVVLSDSEGRTGVGEVPGGQKILKTLEASIPLVVGQKLDFFRAVKKNIQNAFHSLDQAGRGIQTYDQRVMIHVVTGVEAAMLDLLGKEQKKPVAALLGQGIVRKSVPVLGYLFFIGDPDRSSLPYVREKDSSCEWYRYRREEALTPTAIVRLAKAAESKYGFKDFKLKGGVFSGDKEIEVIRFLKEAFPSARLTIDPNGCWTLEESLEYAKVLKPMLSYLEDPCGSEGTYSGREILAEFIQKTGISIATNMVATNWRELKHATALKAVSIPLADPHFWTMEGSVAVGQYCKEHGLVWGCHSNNHFDISLAMMVHTAAAIPGEISAIDTHWIWQEGMERLTCNPLMIQNGCIDLPEKPGLGIELDWDRVRKANELYCSLESGERNDKIAMQALIPGWEFDAKRPSMIR